jgi:aminoglycoside phosphotransferase (APT) family kinase protein
LEGHAQLGEGREAEIFAWEPGTVLRLLRPSVDPTRVEREFSAMRAAAAAGVPVPAVHGTTLQGGRAGIIMDRVDGPDLIMLMSRRPWTISRVAHVVGATQARLHAVPAPTDLPNLRDHIRARINAAVDLPRSLAEFAVGILATLPDADRLCHGDFHPGNILCGTHGPSVIDWADATRGDPMGDLARTRLILRMGVVPDTVPASIRRLQAFGRGAFLRLYLRGYRRVHAIDDALVDRWEVARAADRIFERIDGELPALLEMLERRARASG